MMTPLPGQTSAKEQSKTTEAQATPKESAPNTGTPSKTETLTTITTAKSETKADGPTREPKSEPPEKAKAPGEGSREKSETTPQENLRRATQAARETERGEDFTGMRRSAGYQQAKGEQDVRHHHLPREASTSNPEQTELRQSHSSQSSQGEGENRGNQEKPGEEMQQRSDRGERQRRRQNPQGGLEAESEDEEAALELEERAS